MELAGVGDEVELGHEHPGLAGAVDDPVVQVIDLLAPLALDLDGRDPDRLEGEVEDPDPLAQAPLGGRRAALGVGEGLAVLEGAARPCRGSACRSCRSRSGRGSRAVAPLGCPLRVSFRVNSAVWSSKSSSGDFSRGRTEASAIWTLYPAAPRRTVVVGRVLPSGFSGIGFGPGELRRARAWRRARPWARSSCARAAGAARAQGHEQQERRSRAHGRISPATGDRSGGSTRADVGARGCPDRHPKLTSRPDSESSPTLPGARPSRYREPRASLDAVARPSPHPGAPSRCTR